MKNATSVLLIVFCLCATGAALAQPIPVAILGGPGGGAAWNRDVQSALQSSNQFSVVDVYPINTTTPTLAQLMTYKAVLVYSDGPRFQDSTTLGNNLADYVDAGGGVVVAVFADASIPFAGRFATDDYWALEPLGQAAGKPLHLSAIHEPGSPLLAGVVAFSGGSSSYYGTGALNPAAIDVADWSNGAPLIARRVIGNTNRVDLNFYPVSNRARSDFWKYGTDGVKLMANALNYVAGVAAPAPPSWISLQPSGTPPSPRAESSAVYNAAGNQLILFGGNTAGCDATAPSLNDTWSLTAANGLAGTPAWNQITPSGGPPPVRRGHTAVYNQATDRMVVFGGDAFGCSTSKYNDLWVLAHASGAGGTPTWQMLTPSGGPPPARSDHVAVYNQATGEMIVFGGIGTSQTNLNDVWVLSNADGSSGTPQWSNLSPTGTAPTTTAYMAGTYDPGTNNLTVFSGWICCSGPTSNAAFILAGADGSAGAPQWKALRPNGTAPVMKLGARGVYNPATNAAEYFGGGGTNVVWSLSNANGAQFSAWTKLSPTGTPPEGRGGLAGNPSVVLDPSSNRMIIFGGNSVTGMLNDTWVLAQ